jgi:hypothetical protein
MGRLAKAGAAEVVPETLEASLMLASHALVLVGVPINRVLKRIRETRSQRYRLLRGFYRGLTDREEEAEHQLRLHSVWLEPGAAAIGQTLAELDLDSDWVARSARFAGVASGQLSPHPKPALKRAMLLWCWVTRRRLRQRSIGCCRNEKPAGGGLGD